MVKAGEIEGRGYKYNWDQTSSSSRSSSRGRRWGRLGVVNPLLVDLELVDLVLERVEVDLFESPLSRCSHR